MPPSAEANAKVRGAGSPGASVQSAGNRRFTVSDGGISAKVRATVEDGSAGSPARVLEPANRPPIAAPPRRARHAITPVLIRLDRPRMSTTPVVPNGPHHVSKPSVIMAVAGHFFGLSFVPREG